jgi:hypothetical protein
MKEFAFAAGRDDPPPPVPTAGFSNSAVGK